MGTSQATRPPCVSELVHAGPWCPRLEVSECTRESRCDISTLFSKRYLLPRAALLTVWKQHTHSHLCQNIYLLITWQTQLMKKVRQDNDEAMFMATSGGVTL